MAKQRSFQRVRNQEAVPTIVQDNKLEHDTIQIIPFWRFKWAKSRKPYLLFSSHSSTFLRHFVNHNYNGDDGDRFSAEYCWPLALFFPALVSYFNWWESTNSFLNSLKLNIHSGHSGIRCRFGFGFKLICRVVHEPQAGFCFHERILMPVVRSTFL